MSKENANDPNDPSDLSTETLKTRLGELRRYL